MIHCCCLLTDPLLGQNVKKLVCDRTKIKISERKIRDHKKYSFFKMFGIGNATDEAKICATDPIKSSLKNVFDNKFQN